MSGRNVAFQSCKRTLLSWAGRHGENWDGRLVLGGHVGHVKSLITYSRDALARPLMVLEKILSRVCNGQFKPDETRSGRFASLPKDDAAENLVPEALRCEFASRRQARQA